MSNQSSVNTYKSEKEVYVYEHEEPANELDILSLTLEEKRVRRK